jgi:hypothetical protein
LSAAPAVDFHQKRERPRSRHAHEFSKRIAAVQVASSPATQTRLPESRKITFGPLIYLVFSIRRAHSCCEPYPFALAIQAAIMNCRNFTQFSFAGKPLTPARKIKIRLRNALT